MSEWLLIILFVIGITAAVTIANIMSQLKLKERIKSEWGKLPRGTNKDVEESLKKGYLHQHLKKDAVIDDLTWNDLDLYDVFNRINLTYSSIGSEALYARLRTYNFNHQELTELESLIQYFEAHPSERADLSFRFARLGKKDFNYATNSINEQEENPLKNQQLFTILALLPIIGFFIIPFFAPLGLTVFIGSICFNSIFYLIKKGSLETELSAMSYLVQGISLGVALSKEESPYQEELKKASQPFKSILKFAFAFRVKTGGEMEMMIEMLGSTFLLPFISYNAVFKKVKKHQKEAVEMWHILGNLEVAIAVLNLRIIYGEHWCYPEFQSTGVTSKDVIHPLLDEPVPNPIHWNKSTLITGSNASGKSTYVRAVAVNCLFAQTINTCLATSFKLQTGHIISSMGVKDSIQDGDSYFIAELKSLQRLINQIKKDEFCYCFIDEILKGTNTIERIAASVSIINWLSKRNQLSFIATHDIELPQILKNVCDNIHFEETVTKEEGVTFDYLLKNGVATSRNAIKLIDSMNFPKAIIDEAFERAEGFEENNSWTE